MQDAAVLVVVDLVERIDAAQHLDGLRRTVGPGDRHRQLHARLEARGDARDVELLAAVEAERLAGGARQELQRHDAHADEVRAVDALVALGDHRLDAQEDGALAAQSRDEPLPYRSEEHTSELQSLMRISYAVFCLK